MASPACKVIDLWRITLPFLSEILEVEGTKEHPIHTVFIICGCIGVVQKCFLKNIPYRYWTLITHCFSHPDPGGHTAPLVHTFLIPLYSCTSYELFLFANLASSLWIGWTPVVFGAIHWGWYCWWADSCWPWVALLKRPYAIQLSCHQGPPCSVCTKRNVMFVISHGDNRPSHFVRMSIVVH